MNLQELKICTYCNNRYGVLNFENIKYVCLSCYKKIQYETMQVEQEIKKNLRPLEIVRLEMKLLELEMSKIEYLTSKDTEGVKRISKEEKVLLDGMSDLLSRYERRLHDE